MIEVVLVATTAAIAASISYLLWKARSSESSQIRRVIDLALCGSISIVVAKLIELAVLVIANGSYGNPAIVRYADVASTVVVILGLTLLAISVLDLIMIGKQLRPSGDKAGRLRDILETGPASRDLSLSAVPAILFRRNAQFSDKEITSTFLNNKIEEVLGFSQQEVQSDPHFLTWLMHPEDRQQFLSGDNDLAPGQLEAIFDSRFKHRSGSYRWIRTHITQVEDEHGTFKELIGCGFDITELKETEEQLTEILETDPCALVPDGEFE